MLNEVMKSDVLDHLAYALFQFGDKLKAYKLTKELVKMRPNDQRVQDNLVFFHQQVSQSLCVERSVTMFQYMVQ